MASVSDYRWMDHKLHLLNQQTGRPMCGQKRAWTIDPKVTCQRCSTLAKNNARTTARRIPGAS